MVGALFFCEVYAGGFALHSRWWFAAGCGAILWTLVEYLVHRFVYHKVPLLKELHGMHHSYPCDLIGSPIWVSVVCFSSFLVLVASIWDFGIADGATGGVIVGYISYLLVHDAVHR